MLKIFRKDTDKLSFYAKNITTIMTFFRVFLKNLIIFVWRSNARR